MKKWVVTKLTNGENGMCSIRVLGNAPNRSTAMHLVETVENRKYEFWDIFDDTNEVVIDADGNETFDGFDIAGEGIHICYEDVNESDAQIKWNSYLFYLKSWIDGHRDVENLGMSPACYNEWLDNDCK